MLAVRGFRSYDEVHAYVQKLYSDKHMATRLEGIRSLLILEENLKLLGTRYSFEDYRKFYEENFQPMEIPEELQIESETILRGEDEVDETLPKKKDEDTEIEVETDEDDDFPFGF